MLPARSSDNITGPPGAADQPLGWFSLPSKDVISPRDSERRDRDHDKLRPSASCPPVALYGCLRACEPVGRLLYVARRGSRN
jgi:hypothetical protein